jgi:phosphatidylserine/phosphatidylglycerophosphate/cardiolipin synthase-like enzyme
VTLPQFKATAPGTDPSLVRHIRSRSGARQVGDLLQNVFAAELVVPSRCLWIVSPWISDIIVLDNQANAFTTIAREWPRTRIRLVSVLAHLIRRGTGVVIATRPDEHNIEFLSRLEAVVGETDRLYIHKTHTLHEKGLLGDRYYLSGSMNLTYNGITFNEEVVHFFTDAPNVASTRHTFVSRWGIVGVTESVA